MFSFGNRQLRLLPSLAADSCPRSRPTLSPPLNDTVSGNTSSPDSIRWEEASSFPFVDRHFRFASSVSEDSRKLPRTSPARWETTVSGNGLSDRTRREEDELLLSTRGKRPSTTVPSPQIPADSGPRSLPLPLPLSLPLPPPFPLERVAFLF